MKYVVTGGAGFIGSSIAKLLVEAGHDVSIVDNLHAGSMSRMQEIQDRVLFHNADVRNFEGLRRIVHDADGIFHQAALTSVPESFHKQDEYFDVNVNGTQNIFRLAEELRIKVVFASSSSVYGNVERVPIREDFAKNPISPYGQTKDRGETLAKQFWKKGADIIGLRYFNVYGTDQAETDAGVITQFMRRISADSPPIIHGKGDQIRDFIYVGDAAKANIMAMESNVSQDLLNIGTGKPTLILELADLMIKISSKTLRPIFDEGLPGDIEKSQADVSHARESVGWRHEMELVDGVKQIMAENLGT